MQNKKNTTIFGIAKVIVISICFLFSHSIGIYGYESMLSEIFRSCISLIGLGILFEGILQYRIGSKRKLSLESYSRIKNTLLIASIIRLIILCWMFLNIDQMYDYFICFDMFWIPDYTVPRTILIFSILCTLGEIFYRIENSVPKIESRSIPIQPIPDKQVIIEEENYCPWCGIKHNGNLGKYCSNCGKEL